MSLDARKNFAISTVATAPSPATSGTSLVVAAGAGANFPAAPFNAVIWPTGANPTAANAEIVRVTAKSTDTFTITRTQESTSARTVIVGDQIMQAVTSRTLTDIEEYLTGVTSPTLLTPTIASFTNAQHNHQNAAGGGTLAESALALTNITTNDVSTSRHGFAPIAPNDSGKALRGTGAWVSDWWEELGRTTASGGANPTSLSVSFTAKKFIKIVMIQFTGGSSLTSIMRFNNDSAGNYQYRTSENGGADSTSSGQTGISLGANALEGMIGWYEVINVAAHIKAGAGFNTYYTAGATQLYRNSQAVKWENSAAQISRVDMIATAGSYKDGSELIILGHD